MVLLHPNLAPVVDKKKSSEYDVLRGFVPVELLKKFKFYCVERGLDNSEGLEEVLTEFFQLMENTHSASNEGIVSQNPPSIAKLIQGWDLKQLAKVSRIKATRLEELAKGEKPTEQEIIYLGRHLRRSDGTLYQTEALMDICDRDFPNNHTEGKPITNGA